LQVDRVDKVDWVDKGNTKIEGENGREGARLPRRGVLLIAYSLRLEAVSPTSSNKS
jgi:hypothetical protein